MRAFVMLGFVFPYQAGYWLVERLSEMTYFVSSLS